MPKKYSEMLHLRVTKEQMRALALRAAADNRSISDWLRPHLDRLVGVDSMGEATESEVVSVYEPTPPSLTTGGGATVKGVAGVATDSPTPSIIPSSETVEASSEGEATGADTSSGGGDRVLSSSSSSSSSDTESDDLTRLLEGMEDFSTEG